MRPQHIVMRAQRAADGAESATTTVIASTADTDRMGDIVDQQTWRLDDYRANPVILWAHDATIPPVGRAVVDVRDGKLMAEITWDTGTDLGLTVARQFAEGFLSAVSVGFRPGRTLMAGELPEHDPRRATLGKYGVVYLDCALLEISAVPIPANQHALAQREMAAELVSRGLPLPADEDPADVVREALASAVERLVAVLPPLIREAVRAEAGAIAAEVLAQQLEADVDIETPAEDTDGDPVALAWRDAGWTDDDPWTAAGWPRTR